MQSSTNRRTFLKQSSALVGGLGMASLVPSAWGADEAKKPWFEISLAQWSLHRALGADKLDNLDFAKVTREDYGLGAVEYCSIFFKDKAEDKEYLADLKRRAESHDVQSVLIMIDGEGALGDVDADRRTRAIENHYKWVDAAKFLGCHSIRVNARSSGTYDEQMKRATDGLRRLSEFAAKQSINVIVENHGGNSSNGAWLSGVLKQVGLPNCGSLPDFGNFESYDRYKGTAELMPFAKGVSAKSHDFDKEGNETRTDYARMLKIVQDAGYRGYIGIEYEGKKLSEPEGILATKKLLERVRKELA